MAVYNYRIDIVCMACALQLDTHVDFQRIRRMLDSPRPYTDPLIGMHRIQCRHL